MSFQAMAWAYHQLPAAGKGVASSTAKLVLIALANYADEDASTFVGIKRLAGELGLNERTVRRSVDHLLELKLIAERAIRRGKGGTYTTSRYVLALDTTSGHHARRSPSTSGQDARPSEHEPADKVPAHEPQASEPQASRVERERNPAFDALARAGGKDPTALTRSELRTVGVKLAEILEAETQRWYATHPGPRGCGQHNPARRRALSPAAPRVGADTSGHRRPLVRARRLPATGTTRGTYFVEHATSGPDRRGVRRPTDQR
jgi:hypothetical protein